MWIDGTNFVGESFMDVLSMKATLNKESMVFMRHSTHTEIVDTHSNQNFPTLCHFDCQTGN